MNNYQEERMKELFGSLPQNRNMDWDSVAPVIDFEFSRHADPVRARRKNIKRAVKTLKPVKRSIGFFGYKHNKPYQCVVTGVDCRNQDYGDLKRRNSFSTSWPNSRSSHHGLALFRAVDDQ